jgi:hypothetical protein
MIYNVFEIDEIIRVILYYLSGSLTYTLNKDFCDMSLKSLLDDKATQ